MKKPAYLFLLLVISINTIAQDSNHTSKDKMEWWKDAKFGMFIHWGIYSVPAGRYGDEIHHHEWYLRSTRMPVNEYKKFAERFNPQKFDAEEWVKLAKEAGQKYIVITAKHHDGFAMFETKASDFNVVDATPFKRDPLMELAEACKKYDMNLGFYYSQAQDWSHPGGGIYENDYWDEVQKGDMNEYIDKIAIPQVKELLENYGDIAIIWWDTPYNMTSEMSKKFSDLLKPYPKTITNDRLGPEIGGDVETPEQFIPATGYPGRNWEVCMTMNDRWGYSAYNENWKSTKEMLRMLIEIVSKGGNFLLNVGPNMEGEIPQICQDNLLEIGKWLEVNGEALYGTQPSPFHYLSWGRATRKDNMLYLLIYDWPENRTLKVPISNKINNVYLLAKPDYKLKTHQENEHLLIDLPLFPPDPIASVIAIEFEGEIAVKPIPSVGEYIKASSTKKDVEPSFINDNDPYTVWYAKEGKEKAAIEINLEEETPIQAVSVFEPWRPADKITQFYELEYYNGSEWVSILKTQSNKSGFTENIKTVHAKKFRLNLQNKDATPGLREFILYRED